MTDDQIFLANAYLDGELTDAERGIAEADPAVLAEVDRLRTLQASIAAVEPPSDQARETAISAALDAFVPAGQLAAPPPSVPESAPPGPTVVPMLRKRPVMAWLSAAAAVVVIGLFGVLVSRGGGADDSSADMSSAATAEDTEARVADDPTAGGVAEELSDDATSAAEPSQDAVAEAPASEDMTESEAAADDGGGEGTADTVAAPVQTIVADNATEATSSPSAEAAEPLVLGLDEAIDVAKQLLANPAARNERQVETAQNAAVQDCLSGDLDGARELVDLAFLVVFDFDDADADVGIVPAILAVESLDLDAAFNTVSVIDLTTCQIIEEAPLR